MFKEYFSHLAVVKSPAHCNVADDTLEDHERQHILRSYYKHVVGNVFSSKLEGSEKGGTVQHVVYKTLYVRGLFNK